MAKIGSLTADLKLESAAFIAGMRKAAQETARNTSAMSKNMAGLTKSFSQVGASLKTFVAGFIGLRGLQVVGNIVKMADEIGDTAVRLGVGAEELQRFRYAGEQAGLAVGEMDKALMLFQKSLAAGKIQAEGETLTEKFTDFLRQIQNAPTQVGELELAMKAGAKQFGVFLQLARDGPDAFKMWADSAAVFGDESLKAADNVDKQFRQLQQTITVGFGEGFLKELNSNLALTPDKLKAIQSASTAAGGELAKFAQELAGFMKEVNDLATAVHAEIKKAETLAKTATERRLAAYATRMGRKPPPVVEAPEVAKVSELGPNAIIENIVKPLGEAKKTTAALKAENDALVKSWENGTEVFKNELSPAVKQLHETLGQVGDMAASAFTNAIMEGKNFQEVIQQLMKDIAAMIIQMLIAAAIKKSIDAGVSAATGVPVANFHTGGIVGRDGRTSRMMPASMFAGAPRFHGGMSPGEFPAILKKGEGVFTPAQMGALGRGGEVNINIQNRNGSDVQASGEKDAAGNVNIEIIIDQVMGRKLLQPGAASNRALKQGFGAQPVGIRR